MINMDETKGIFRKAINAVNPGWLAFCGGIGLLLFILSISFRIMDFNPGPLWERHYEIILESRKIDNQIKLEMINQPKIHQFSGDEQLNLL